MVHSLAVRARLCEFDVVSHGAADLKGAIGANKCVVSATAETYDVGSAFDRSAAIRLGRIETAIVLPVLRVKGYATHLIFNLIHG